MTVICQKDYQLDWFSTNSTVYCIHISPPIRINLWIYSGEINNNKPIKRSLLSSKSYSRGDQFLLDFPINVNIIQYICSFMKLISDESWKLCYSWERTSCASAWRQRFDELWPTAGDKQWKEPSSLWFDHCLLTLTDCFSSLQKCYASEIE